MKIIGLTGGIGAGKSFIAKILKNMGYKIFDSDAANSNLLEKQETIDFAKKKFPESVEFNKINKTKMANIIFNNQEKLKNWENYIFPKINQMRKEFLKENKEEKFVILESPKLIESKVYKKCDFIILIIASQETRKKRVMKTRNATEKDFDQIIKNQLNDEQKSKYAKYIIEGDKYQTEIKQEINEILKKEKLL